MKNSWNVINYNQFLDLRTRPARDLLSSIPDSFNPHKVYDLGCGPGNETAIKFYKKIGAKAMDEWTVFRLTRAALDNLAESWGDQL